MGGGGGPVEAGYKRLRRRMRRSFYYGREGRMDGLSLPLNEAAVSYFEAWAPFDRLSLEASARLSRDACVQPSSLVLALVYLERLRRADEGHFQRSDPDDLYLATLLLAAKFLQDEGQRDFVYNDEWAASAQMDLARLNRLELRTLAALDWNLGVSQAQFLARLRALEAAVARGEADKRGWKSLSYAEILALAEVEGDAYSKLLGPLAVVVGLASLLYAAAAIAFASLFLCSAPMGASVSDVGSALSANATTATTTTLRFSDRHTTKACPPESTDAAECGAEVEAELLELPQLTQMEAKVEKAEQQRPQMDTGRAALSGLVWIRRLIERVCRAQNETIHPEHIPQPIHVPPLPPLLFSKA